MLLSRRTRDTSTTWTPAVTGISPGPRYWEKNAPQRHQGAAEPPTWRPSPHRRREKKTATSRRPITPRPTDSQPITARDRGPVQPIVVGDVSGRRIPLTVKDSSAFFGHAQFPPGGARWLPAGRERWRKGAARAGLWVHRPAGDVRVGRAAPCEGSRALRAVTPRLPKLRAPLMFRRPSFRTTMSGCNANEPAPRSSVNRCNAFKRLIKKHFHYRQSTVQNYRPVTDTGPCWSRITPCGKTARHSRQTCTV